MLPSAKHSGIHTAPANHRGLVSIDSDIQLFRLLRVVIQRTVHDAADIYILALPHPGHVDQDKAVIVDTFKLCLVLGHHGGIHIMVELFDLLLVVHLYHLHFMAGCHFKVIFHDAEVSL